MRECEWQGDDPIEIARDQTSLQMPDFGESADDLKIEGWISIGFGLMLLLAPSFQIYCHWKEKREARYAHTDGEAQGLLEEMMDGGWLGRKPSVGNPVPALTSLMP